MCISYFEKNYRKEDKMGLFDFLAGGSKPLKQPKPPKFYKPETMWQPTRPDSLEGRVEKLEREIKKSGK
jgi:hypothetical protein